MNTYLYHKHTEKERVNGEYIPASWVHWERSGWTVSTYLYIKRIEKGAGELWVHTCILNALRKERVKGEYIQKRFNLLLRQITLYISLCATYFAVPLVVGRLNYKSATKPCVFTSHFNLSYSRLFSSLLKTSDFINFIMSIPTSHLIWM